MGVRLVKRVGGRSGRHSSEARSLGRRLMPGFRRLAFEPLEDRRLLSVDSPQLELFNVSPALFVENQGQWADESVRFVHQGDGANVAMTDAGPVFQVFRPDCGRSLTCLKRGAGLTCLAGNGRLQARPARRLAADRNARNSRPGSWGRIWLRPWGLEQAETQFNYFVGDAVELACRGAELRGGGLRESLSGHRPEDLGPARQLEVRVPRRPGGRLSADPGSLRRASRDCRWPRTARCGRPGRRLGID